jgi:hypothetical protein
MHARPCNRLSPVTSYTDGLTTGGYVDVAAAAGSFLVSVRKLVTTILSGWSGWS